jgi:lipopolysaccharide export system protein LptA
VTIFLARAPARGGAAPSPAANAAAGPGSSSSHVKHLDCAGPVTVISKTQVATGDRASFDKAQNKVWLLGNVTLSDSGNVTKGDKLTYDLTTGQATVDTVAAGRVKGLFIPGSGGPGGDDKSGASK